MDKILANENMGVHFVFFDEADQPVHEYTQTIDRYLPVTRAEAPTTRCRTILSARPISPAKRLKQHISQEFVPRQRVYWARLVHV